MWTSRDFTGIEVIFDKDIYYSECYGPEYFNLDEIFLSIEDMLDKQKVLKWEIKRFIHAQNIIIVEWSFEEKQGENINEFDGVSIIEFNDFGKISVVKEYESKSEHIAPYRNE